MATIADALKIAFQHHQGGRFQAAEQIYRQILQVDPNHPEALHFLGMMAAQFGKHEIAVEYIGRAVQRKPDYAEAHCDLGVVLKDQGKLDEAVGCYRRALQVKPDYAVAYNNLGNALRELGKLDEAVDCFGRALQVKPDYAVAYSNLSNALREMGKLDEAAACARRALELKPDFAGAHLNLGTAVRDQGKLDEAVGCFRRALQLQPDFAEANNNLGAALMDQGKLVEAAECIRPVLQRKPDNELAHSNLLFCLSHDAAVTPDELFAEHRRWGERHGTTPGPIPPYANKPLPQRRLRLGYVSPDFCAHSVARFLEPILVSHDPSQVEVFAYAEVPAPDAVTQRLRSLTHTWRSTCGLSDAQAAQQIRADRIDILVDLAGHTARNRLRVFAHKPAPVQVTYLGYPFTTGMAAMNYRLTDAIMDPPGEPIRDTEELVRLPCGYWCFHPPAEAPAVGPVPARSTGNLTLGSLHKLTKLNDAVIDLWCRLLQTLPAARLLIVRDTLQDQVQENLRRQFTVRGVEAGRIEMRHTFEGGGPLGNYGAIDISLDPFPWSGPTTACESLWMGVPVVTFRGTLAIGRMVASILTRVGLTDWIADTPEQYLDVAMRLAGDLDRLAELRAGLRERMRQTLCNGQAFTRDLEVAYRQMWLTWCPKNSPEKS